MGHLSQWAILLFPAVKEDLILLPQWAKSKSGHFLLSLVNIVMLAKMVYQIFILNVFEHQRE